MLAIISLNRTYSRNVKLSWVQEYGQFFVTFASLYFDVSHSSIISQ